MTIKQRIYVDSACFVDLVKHRRGSRLASTEVEQRLREDDCWFLRRLCDASRDGAVQIVTSMLAVAECLHVEEVPGPSEETKALFRDFLTSGLVVELVDPDIFIAEKARSLWWDHDIHIKGADAIHVATAMMEECEEFLTLDHRIHNEQSKFARAIPAIARAGLKVVRPCKTTILPEQYRTDDFFPETDT